MESKSVAKVGALVLVALVLGAGLWLYLTHYNSNSYLVHVPFSDTEGLLVQSVVRMQGVSIGEVKKIDLDTTRRPLRPVVTMAIDDKYDIPKDSRFVIVSGLLISNPKVEVVTGNDPAMLVKNGTAVGRSGTAPGALASISPELQEMVAKVNKNFDNLSNKLNASYAKIDKLLDQTSALVKTTNDAASAAKGIIADPTVKRSMLATLDNFRAVSEDAHATSRKLGGELTALAHSGRGDLDNLTNKLGNVLTRLDTTIDSANGAVAKLTEQVTDPRLQQSLQDTVDLVKATLARFDQIASDLHEITGDPKLQSDLKETVTDLNATTKQGQKVLEKVDTLLGKVTGQAGKAVKYRFPSVQLVGNVSEQINPTRLRVDLDARLGLTKSDILDIGLYDFGQDTRLNLQLGNQLTNGLTARYGLYASKIGVGLDYRATPGTGLRADLWDTNHPRLDARAIFGVNRNASIWAGVDSLFQHPVPIVGLEYRH